MKIERDKYNCADILPVFDNKSLYRIEKVSDDVFNGQHPNLIDEGFFVIGYFKFPPCVGERFFIQSPTSREDCLTTSTVTEIIDDETFKTNNSTYSLKKIKVEDVRDSENV